MWRNFHHVLLDEKRCRGYVLPHLFKANRPTKKKLICIRLCILRNVKETYVCTDS